MPHKLAGFVVVIGRRHQAALVGLSVLLFAVGILPLEIQRRIVNGATQGARLNAILGLVAIYLALVVSEGGIKLALNIYRGWIGEVAIRWLRIAVLEVGKQHIGEAPTLAEGVETSIVLAEAEPVGAFVGTSISEPILQAGILLAVGSYMIYLQPFLALAVVAVFVPQSVLVPILQGLINQRVKTKITVMRHLSEEMVDHGSPKGPRHQAARVQRLFSTNMSIYRLKYSLNFMMNLMFQLGYAGIFALGGYYVITGKIEIGTVVAFIAGLNKIADPWGALVDWYRDLKTTQVKYELIRDASTVGPAQ
ncbi:multidrug ABC transporter ATP-binding protein [Rhizobium sp. R72]|uniref:ABC transporter ATP-binding protein n=1 Tax=unclassified Rhizobium TaxID=2613769 RepID=UPI000B6C0E23|nr:MULTISPECIES: ABC transporter ATP-binding protein [unclassified Rhizobium]OWW05413.1 multidrug ABC transporter ATP-binding protein [Rhizobium sp. R72]OWW06470.1 multidrug ABC transporter ATP-binding protein [Rhizobium sp. R711]